MEKKRIGIFELSSCAGCQVEFLNLNSDLLELQKRYEFTHFRFLGIYNTDAKTDVALVEGAVTTPEEIKLLKKVRENTKTLIAFGTCACFGGVPNTKDYFTDAELKEIVYGKDASRNGMPFASLSARGIDEFVKVDYYLRGCPIEKGEALEALNEVFLGKLPLNLSKTVCFECKKRGNKCLFYEQACLGSIIDGGCKARCPSNGVACFACRGPTSDANLEAFTELLKSARLSDEEINNMLRLFINKAHLKYARTTESGL